MAGDDIGISVCLKSLLSPPAEMEISSVLTGFPSGAQS